MSDEIIEIYEKGRLERREMILEHLEKLKPIDVLQISNTFIIDELADYVQRQRLDVLNLCLPEAKEKTND